MTRPTMGIDMAELKRAISTDDDIWAFGNNILYQLCREHPKHESPKVVVAKIWLIGRSYAAAIERRDLRFDGGILMPNDKFYKEVVAPQMIRSEIDKRIAALRRSKAVNDKNIAEVIDTHACLTRIFHDFTGKSKRSLASKYLHFHLPEHFYLYDSRAVVGLRMLGRAESPSRPRVQGCDAEYMKFALRMLELQEDIERCLGKRLRPRELDKLLLNRVAKAGAMLPS